MGDFLHCLFFLEGPFYAIQAGTGSLVTESSSALYKDLFTLTAGAFVAGIYVTSGWQMTTGVAVAWGLGLSLGTNLLSMLISWVPLYSFL